METKQMMQVGAVVRYELEGASGVRRGIGKIKCPVPRYGVYRVFDESGYEMQLVPEDVSPLNVFLETVIAAERHEVLCPNCMDALLTVGGVDFNTPLFLRCRTCAEYFDILPDGSLQRDTAGEELAA